MLTRRAALGSLAGGLLLGNDLLNFQVPEHACDCHTHIIGDPRQFPFFPGRIYTPQVASPQEMSALHRRLHIERVVIVTPSVYGTDNRATLYGLKARGNTARGIAVIDEKTSDRELDALAKAGIVGIRLNLATGGQTDPASARPRFTAALNRIKTRGWHLQMYASLAVISRIKDLVSASPVPVVFDHFGGAQAALGFEQPGFADLIGLLSSGSAYVKISGAYRASKQSPDYLDVVPFARAFVAANPDRVLWGTDWPHPDTSPTIHPMEVTPRLPIDDGRLFDQFPSWVPDPSVRKKILVDNPARLYGF